MSEINALDSIRLGNKQAFEQLFKEMYQKLCVYACSILHNEEMARDTVQQVFLILWEKRENISHENNLKSYLYKSVYNTALNLLKHDRVKQDFTEFIMKNEVLQVAEVEQLFEEEYKQHLLKEVYKAIEHLPKQCQEIFLLSRFSGKKSTEIAQELNLSTRTVEHQLYRAMKSLREQLLDSKNRNILLFYFFNR